MTTDCAHTDVAWYRAVNEDGWTCAQCGTLGFRPDLDRSQIQIKVANILTDMHEDDFVYVANSTEGDLLTAEVAQACVNSGLYDQYSIISLIMGCTEMLSHADYWHKRAQAWLQRREEGKEGPSQVEAMKEAGWPELFGHEGGGVEA